MADLIKGLERMQRQQSYRARPLPPPPIHTPPPKAVASFARASGNGFWNLSTSYVPTFPDRTTHTCLVTDVARCSVNEAKRRGSYAPLILPVARAIAAQLILAVAYLHGKGLVHGDLHLGNVLLRVPQAFRLWSDEELLERCGEPELEPVQTFDDKPIPPGVPTVATLPVWFPMERINKLPLSNAYIVLADFGESYRPSQESKFECCTPVHCRPPENRVEPTKPKPPSPSGPCSRRYGVEDTVTSMQVQALGKLPDEWWEKWDARSKDFTEEGQPIRADDSPVYTFDYQFEDAMQKGRRRYKMETMDSAEKEALLAMLRPMLAYRPEQRCSVKEVLGSEWMTSTRQCTCDDVEAVPDIYWLLLPIEALVDRVVDLDLGHVLALRFEVRVVWNLSVMQCLGKCINLVITNTLLREVFLVQP
ncbi:hypothetical protein ACRALDRAFT_1072061 [Sodiomyces alcalophilus JCM 7366]|uniref:uncharacterized protein n=1 Tax=Sodiomyces alcalophilus JCM 7366 TaxID=591952 RepID=UPI0039B64C55